MKCIYNDQYCIGDEGVACCEEVQAVNESRVVLMEATCLPEGSSCCGCTIWSYGACSHDTHCGKGLVCALVEGARGVCTYTLQDAQDLGAYTCGGCASGGYCRSVSLLSGNYGDRRPDPRGTAWVCAASALSNIFE